VGARKGDTVARLAERYRQSAAQVAQWNDTKVNAAFRAGQQVVLFVPVRMAGARAQSAARHSATRSSGPVRKQAATTKRSSRPAAATQPHKVKTTGR